MTGKFNPARLQLARERRGLMKKKLAELCRVTTQTVSNWENNVTAPGEDEIAKLSAILEFPIEFFFRPDLEQLPDGAVSFRGRTRVSAHKKKAAIAAGQLACELGGWIEERFDLPEVSVPDLSDLTAHSPGTAPELAAEIVRKEWKIGDRPIPDIIRLLESRGVLIFSLAQDCHDLDAFSFRFGRRLFILLDTTKSYEHTVMDAAHELGHLLLHRVETGRKEEDQANAFAGAFLMPKRDLFTNIGRLLDLPSLIQKKHRWQVSLAALVYRLGKLGMLTEWQYRTLFFELSGLGYRTREPNPLPRIPSALLSQVLELLKKRGVSLRRISAELAWNPRGLNELIFGLGARLTAVDGGNGSAHRGEAPLLRLV